MTGTEAVKIAKLETILEGQKEQIDKIEARIEKMQASQDRMEALLNQAKGFKLAGFFLIGTIGAIGGWISQWVGILRA